MRIELKLKADLVGMKTTPNQDGAGKTTTVILRAKVTADVAEKEYGETFARLAFGPMTVKDGVAHFAYASIKPDIVVEKHMVTLIGHGPIPVMPKLSSIVPAGEEEAVHITLELPLSIEKKSFAADIWSEIGEVVEVELEAVQMQLPLAEDGEEAEPPPARGVRRSRGGSFGNGPQVEEQ